MRVALLCLVGSVCAQNSVFPQNKIDDVAVELKSDVAIVRMVDTLTFLISVTNNTQETLYLVVEEKPDPGYNLATRQLGFSLDMQTTNFHYFEFPKLKKLRPKCKTELIVKIPVSSWKAMEAGKLNPLDSGKWTVMASIGILEEQKLKNKLKDLGFSLKGKIKMTAMDFLELQTVFYSNEFQIEILDT